MAKNVYSKFTRDLVNLAGLMSVLITNAGFQLPCLPRVWCTGVQQYKIILEKSTELKDWRVKSAGQRGNELQLSRFTQTPIEIIVST